MALAGKAGISYSFYWKGFIPFSHYIVENPAQANMTGYHAARQHVILDIADESYGKVDAMEELLARITIDPAICHGKPTIRGLRYPIDLILELLSSGMSNDEIIADYPDLEPDDIRAVFAYALRLSQVKRIELHAA